MLANAAVRTLCAAVFALYANLAYAQDHSTTHSGQSRPAEQAQSVSPTSSEIPEIFCATMTTGQLCSHGTADKLKLSGNTRERWIEASRRYNQAVNAATTRLLEDAKAVLTAEEFQRVEKWFAQGLNPEINRILATK